MADPNLPDPNRVATDHDSSTVIGERPGSVCSNMIGACSDFESSDDEHTAVPAVNSSRHRPVLDSLHSRPLLTCNETLDLPPKVNGEPVKVYCTTVVKNVSRIDAVEESAYAVFSVNMYWYDHRVRNLRLTPSGTLPRDVVTLWRPGFTFPQGDNGVFVSNSPSWQDVRVEDHKLGLVSTWGEFKGSVAMQVDLQHFPFDECRLECRFTGGRQRDGTPSNKQEFVLMDCPPPEARFEHLSFLNLVPLDFENRCSHRIVGLYTKSQAMGDVSTVTWGLLLRRNSSFYLWRCLFGLWLLFLCSLSAYTIDARQMGSRVEVSSTLIVGAMAVLFVFTNEMPKTGSLTRMDMLFISTLVLMVIPVLETAIITRYLLSQEEGVWPDKEPTESAVGIARQVDYIVAALSVVLYIGINIYYWFLPSSKLNAMLYIPQNGIPEVWKYMSWSVENSSKFCKFTPEQVHTPKEESAGQDSSKQGGTKFMTMQSNPTADVVHQKQSAISHSSPATVHPK